MAGKDRHQKIGKGRQDEYYHEAKRLGYRSRAAFKILELGKQFSLFNNVSSCIDLCAAPGGWTQVAGQNMPPGSIVVAIDLDPIPRIDPNSVQARIETMVGDITAESTLKRLEDVLQKHNGSKVADLVLNDGAPNMGADWNLDSYNQNVLVLAAFKHAASMLRVGGTFVTKVFRSMQYNHLMFVFNELFGHVVAHSVKASRDTSAEIFVVCSGFNPNKYKSFDNRYFDPAFVFKDVSGEEKTSIKDIVSTKPNRAGYDHVTGGLIERRVTLSDFLTAADPNSMLKDTNVITVDPVGDATALAALEEVGQWPREARGIDVLTDVLSDVKLIDAKTIRALLKWQRTVRVRVQRYIGQSMAQDADDSDVADDDDSSAEDSGSMASDDSDENDATAATLKALKRREKAELRRSLRRKKARLARMVSGSMDPLMAVEAARGDSKDLFSQRLIVQQEKAGEDEPHTTMDDQDAPMQEEESSGDESDVDMMRATLVNRPATLDTTEKWYQRVNLTDDEEEVDATTRRLEGSEWDSGTEEEEPEEEVAGDESDWTTDDSTRMAEKLAMGGKMMKLRAARDAEDAAYNRYTADDDGTELPEWFSIDDAHHNRPMIPVTKAEVDEVKARRQKITDRPARKLLEFKGRVMRKRQREDKRIMAQAEQLAEREDMAPAEKRRAAEKLGKQRAKINVKPQQKPKAKRLDRRMRADGPGHALQGGKGRKALRKGGVLAGRMKAAKNARRGRGKARK